LICRDEGCVQDIIGLMRWRIFTCIAVISLILFIATIALWVHSYNLWDQLWWKRQYLSTGLSPLPGASVLSRDIALISTHGEVEFSYLRIQWGRGAGEEQSLWSVLLRPEFVETRPPNMFLHGPRGKQTPLERLGFSWSAHVGRGPEMLQTDGSLYRGSTAYSLAVGMPEWFVASLTLLAPAAWIGSRIRVRGIRRKGCCPTCGYDLRATPDRCPECGRISGNPT